MLRSISQVTVYYFNYRLFKQYLAFIAVNQMAGALFRFMGGLARNMVIANTFGSFALLIFMVLGGFLLTRGTMTYS